MKLEKALINKSYYQNLVEESRREHPIKILGEMFMEEEHKDVPELSTIRFAQGEVYFQNKDYETAIFKWENVSNDLRPWAQKNTADAYFKLNLMDIAEDYYHSVETESDVLKAEILLQLFSLYQQLEEIDKAADAIKKAVDLNPDYDNVTQVARTFFEQHQDWGNAIKLAANEAVRTKSLTWFVVLEGYVDRGHTCQIPPNYFNNVLKTLYYINLARFESLVFALWKSYQSKKLYFLWLEEINQLTQEIRLGGSYIWKKLSVLYKETYFELISGKLLINEFSYLIPNHLINWLNLATTSDTPLASAAILSWNELFPKQLEDSVIHKAEESLSQSDLDECGLEDAYVLLESLSAWAEKEGWSLGSRLKWMVQELKDTKQFHLLLTGPPTSGKSAFINGLINEELLEEMSNATLVIKDNEEKERVAFLDNEETNVTHINDFRNYVTKPEALIHSGMPVSFLRQNHLTLIDFPTSDDFYSTTKEELYLADSVLFVLNADVQLSEEDLKRAVSLSNQVTHLPIHFLLWKRNQFTQIQNERKRLDQISAKIHNYFPEAKVTTFTADDMEEKNFKALSQFVRSIADSSTLDKRRTTNVLNIIKRAIEILHEKRAEIENTIVEKISLNEEFEAKFKGTYHQLSDMEEERVQGIKTSYSKIKEELRQNLIIMIPGLLRNCSELVKEDSDFGKIHLELNEEMNKRVAHFIENTVLPDFQATADAWIAESKSELKECQEYLDEMCHSFNQLYGRDKITLECDWKVLDDWRRDVNRMTRGNLELDQVNILLRSTPSQLLLKSAGKLLGSLSKNKEMLHKRYKQFIESQDYNQIAESITDQFMQPFVLFEKSLERDIKMFFTLPFEILKNSIDQTHGEIERNQEFLANMQKNPESYLDPLTLFQLKHRQLQLVNSDYRMLLENKVEL